MSNPEKRKYPTRIHQAEARRFVERRATAPLEGMGTQNRRNLVVPESDLSQ